MPGIEYILILVTGNRLYIDMLASLIIHWGGGGYHTRIYPINFSQVTVLYCTLLSQVTVLYWVFMSGVDNFCYTEPLSGNPNI